MKEIYINVESENDIYSTFGGPGDLNGEFVDYVIGKLKESEILEPVQLVFQSREPMNEQRVRDSLSMWIKKERHELQREEHTNKIHQMCRNIFYEKKAHRRSVCAVDACEPLQSSRGVARISH